MVVNYQLGKIYKIVDNTNGNIYIGSTCETTLARRLNKLFDGCLNFNFDNLANHTINISLVSIKSSLL